MITFEILKAGATHENPKVNLARKNFSYEGQDLIVGFRLGTPVEVQALGGIAAITGQGPESIEDALDIYQAYLAAQ